MRDIFPEKKRVHHTKTNEPSRSDVRHAKHTSDTKNKEGVLWVLFAGIFVLLPLFFIPGTSIPSNIGKLTLLSTGLLLVAFLWLLSALVRGQLKLPKDRFFIALASLFGVYVLSSLFSQSFTYSLLGEYFEIDTVLTVLLFVITVVLGTLLLSSYSKIRKVYTSLFVVFGVIALFQFIKLFLSAAGIPLTLGGLLPDPTSNVLGKWNDVGMYAGLFTILSLITLEMPLSRLKKIAVYGIGILGLGLLVVVNFKLTWVIVGIFALLHFVYTFSFGLHYSRKPGGESFNLGQLPLRSLAVFLISLLFIIGGGSIVDSVNSYFGISQVEVRPAWFSTFSIAEHTFDANPLLGSGPNTFRNQWMLHKTVDINSTLFWNTNFNTGVGIVPTSLVTTGLLGVAAWLSILYLLIVLGIRSLSHLSSDPRLAYVEISSFIASLFGWVFLILYIPNSVMIAMTFFFMGIFLSSQHQKGSLDFMTLSGAEDQKQAFVVSFTTIALLIGIVGWGYIGTTRFVGTMYYQKGLSYAQSEEASIDQVESSLLKAVRFYENDRYYRMLTDVSLVKLGQLVSSANLSEEEARSNFQDALAEAVERARSALEVDQSSYLNWLKLGEVYASIVPLQIDGAYDSAISAYQQAGAYNPQNPEVELRIARLEASRGDLDAARVKVQEALQKKSNYTEAVFFLSQIEAQSGNTVEAIRATESAALLVPDDPTVFFQLGLLYYNDEQYEEALPPFERAVQLFPSYSNAKYFLGLTYYELERIDEAVAEFEGLQELNPDNREVVVIKNNLIEGLSPFTGIEVDQAPQQRDNLPIDEE